MNRFAVFSGFLGAGKTTAMMALTRPDGVQRVKTAMISNDLGGQGLADDRFARLSGCRASELTDECICYQRENLLQRLRELFDDGCGLVLSDIPGFGVGALEHVYHGLRGQVELAPFTVLTEHDTVQTLRGGGDADLRFLMDAQLAEADLIVLNKCDRLSAQQRAADAAFLLENYPQAQVLCISARTGEGLEVLSEALCTQSASMRRPDVGYGGEAFLRAMTRMSEYYLQYRAAVCCGSFDGSAYLAELADAVRAGVAAAGFEIPHLKLLAWTPEGDFGKADLLGTARGVERTRDFVSPCTDIAVVLNGSAACPFRELDDIVTGAVETVSERFRLELSVFGKECFGMGKQ